MQTFETISTLTIEIKSDKKKDIETHIKETIKKDNVLPKIEIEEVPDNREIAIPSSSGTTLRRSKRIIKKPYEKNE